MGAPKILVFDSGLGGLTVYGELRACLPDAHYLYIADNAAFPYGGLRDDELVSRLLVLFARLIDRENPDVCVIACNTASTVALEALRARFKVPFVGTVPAIKTAAEKTSSGLFSVLATPGTVSRRYTRDLVACHASSCEVTLVGAKNLADLAEQFMRGEKIDEEKLLQEIAPAFVTKEHWVTKKHRRTDMIALGCTHYPLLVREMEKVAPWEVSYIDPAPAIARRTRVVLSQSAPNEERPGVRGSNRLIYTGENNLAGNISVFLRNIGLADVYRDEIIG